MMWQRSDQWIGTEIDDNFVMVNIDSGNYVALNVTANAVWQALETPRNEDEIVSQLVSQFVVDADQCRASVATALATMSEMVLVRQV